ncbi:MAG TPA: 3-isopropylmalate dehydratase large subunit [Rhabdaerophilum sp.]|nr:3-isopropylmalate dehydratase large subunit [Rhabdaerophilum sp.]
MSRPRTLFDKLWDSHVIVTREDGEALLWVDRHFVHEGSHHAFRALGARNATLAEPGLTFGVADHYVPTRGRPQIADPEIAGMVARLSDNARRHGFRHFDLDDPAQGIVHVVGPEQGLTLPGLLIVCGDSHTSTHGAFGAYAFGIGASEVAHVLETQTLWQRKPKTMRITVSGRLGRHISAKDLALHVIRTIGADGARGHAVEYDGPAITALSMEGRLTLCNMSIEAGARCAMVAPDETTVSFLRGRPFAPKGDAFEKAAEAWRGLATDPSATFDSTHHFRAEDIAPLVTWGVSPEDALPIDACVPSFDASDPARAGYLREALGYMGLEAGQSLETVAIDRVFIGSCTNARIEDLRAAAAVLAGKTARVPGLVSPGSSRVKAAAEAEGLADIFTAAGLVWADSGCSMCVGMNGDRLSEGERCASTTNRNFRGRQGKGARTHLMSPAMVAAAALHGHLFDIRRLED